MNILRTWLLFHKPERHYHKLSYELANTSSLLNKLNSRRKAIQREISELSKSNESQAVCGKCGGACCQGEYDHFTVIDYLIRSFSDNPLKGYGDIWKPKPFYSLVLGQIKSKSKNERKGDGKHNNGCPHLGASGCKIEVEDRPIRCILWTCREFREVIPQQELEKIGLLVKELDLIAIKVASILK